MLGQDLVRILASVVRSIGICDANVEDSRRSAPPESVDSNVGSSGRRRRTRPGCGSSRHGSVAGRGLGEIASWVGNCGRRREEGSKSRVVNPIAGRNWKHVALAFALPKTSAIRALPSCEETGTFVMAPSASRLAR
jgi:hypothetical protein